MDTSTNKPFSQTQVDLLQRHIDKRDRQLKQYRKELEEAEFNLSIYREGLQKIIAKYAELGVEIQEPLETKLLCSNILVDAKKLLLTADL